MPKNKSAARGGSSAAPPQNLSDSLTSFIGRENEVAELCQLLRSGARCVTLIGPGGVGKTRLALQVAAILGRPPNANARQRYPDGIWLTELAPIGDPDRVVWIVASAVGLQEGAGKRTLDRLGEYLRERRLLLVLDNCEHVIDACAAMVDRLLRVCPGLQMLATSREPLDIAGESAWRVAPLPVVSPDALPPLHELAAHGAIRLFVERATAASREFELTAACAPAVARVCWRLDGMPLAIELAAARVPALSTEQIAARLDDRFRLLTGGNRSTLPRQQTLRATIDWSHDLLTEPERVALRRLAVFSGGCTLEAAEAVCAGSPTDNDPLAARDVLDVLALLVRKSLILAEGEDAAVRYQLLETLREYAWEKLRAADEEVATRRRHRDWYTSWAEHWWIELVRHEQERWSARFEADHDNFIAALEWSRTEATGESDPGAAPAFDASAVDAANAELRLAAALGRFWVWRGHWHESVAWLEDALLRARPDPSPARALALNWAGWLGTVTGAVGNAPALLEESAAMAGQVGDWNVRSLALRHRALIADALGDDERLEILLQEALVSARRSGEERELAWCLLQMALFAQVRGDLATAERLALDSLRAGRRAGDRATFSHTLLYLGQMAIARGRYAEAASLLQEALKTSTEISQQNAIAAAHRRFGDLARAQGDHSAAHAAYAVSLAVARGAGVGIEAGWTLLRCAGLCFERGAFERAARLFGAADAWQEGTAATNLPGIFGRGDRAHVTLDLTATRAALGEADFGAAFADGQAMTLAQALAYAVADPPPGTPPQAAAGRTRSRDLLTLREREVARLIAAGSSNRLIAEELVIAEATVERHVANIFAKLDVHSRAQVAAWIAAQPDGAARQ